MYVDRATAILYSKKYVQHDLGMLPISIDDGKTKQNSQKAYRTMHVENLTAEYKKLKRNIKKIF